MSLRELEGELGRWPCMTSAVSSGVAVAVAVGALEV